MTIMEAIRQADALTPNVCAQAEKIRWLSHVDATVKAQIVDTHEGYEKVAFTGYDENTDLGTVLLVPAPYDILYLRGLQAQIHLANNEREAYNNMSGLYNTALLEYANHYNRQHMPLGKKIKFF